MPIAEIAAEQNMPQKFLERILLDLKNRGYVVSRRVGDARLIANATASAKGRDAAAAAMIGHWRQRNEDRQRR